MMDSTQKVCLLFTKRFPYGNAENYLLHELPFLLDAFDRVIAVPYDEFKYDPLTIKPNIHSKLEIFPINNARIHLSIGQKIKREWNIRKVLVSEISKSREWRFHIRDSRKLIIGLRQLYQSSMALKSFLITNGLNESNTLFYHYWLHRGVMIAYLAHKFQSTPRFKNVARGHTRDMYHKSWNDVVKRYDVFLPYEKTKWEFVDHVFPISEHAYQFVKKVLPQHVHKTSVARLGVFSNTLPTYHPPQQLKHVVTCSHVDSNKRVHLLAEILQHLPFQFRWTHFGAASEEGKKDLETRCASLGSKVSLELKGSTPNAEIIQFYHQNRIDLFFTLSLVESLPVSLMEAAAAGIPMVSTEVVATPEIVNDANGYLMPVHFDPQEVAKRIQPIFENEELWISKSKAARHMFEERFNAQKNFTDFAHKLVQMLPEY